MKKCILVCAGDFCKSEFLKNYTPDAYTVAADAGLSHLDGINVTPDLIIGDFDSLGRVPEGAVVLPVKKDVTDSFAAADAALEKGCDEFLIFGALGGKRLSHTLGNFALLSYLRSKGAKGTLYADGCIVTLIAEETVSFPKEKRGSLSLAVYGESATVSIEGMTYGISRRTVTKDSCLCISNSFAGTPATVTVHEGAMLCIEEF